MSLEEFSISVFFFNYPMWLCEGGRKKTWEARFYSTAGIGSKTAKRHSFSRFL